MIKFVSLLKAMFSQDMNIFKYKANSNSKIKKILFPLFLGIILMLAVGIYAYGFAEPLSKIGLTYIMLTLFMIIVTVVTFMEGMYKSQGILFDCKDNDLLFSLPIHKSKIFALRVIKLLVFQFIYNLFCILPAYAMYIYFETPSINFYVISILMLFLLPIIPTVISVILGYIVKGISSKFKAKKIIQTVLSLILFLGIFFLSYNLENIIANLTQKATSINDALTKIYYPVGAYINLIQKFDFIELLKLIAINIIPLIIVIYIGSIKYFKIISKSVETNSSIKANSKEQIKVRTPIKALIKKELSRFFSTPVYMFNTSFGILIMLIASIALCINSDGLIQMVTQNEGMDIEISKIYEILPKIFMQLVIFVGCMTSITSSSISLEGKSFNITKSLPIKTEKILLSKIISSNIITLPIMILSDLIFIIKFDLSLADTLLILAFTLIIPIVTAILGLIINLKYPKMNASSDTEVVKQSMSTMISVFIGMFIFAVSTLVMIKGFEYINLIIPIELGIFIVILVTLWLILKNYGNKRIREINV